MIVGIGCDIVDISRLEKNQELLAKRILSKQEYLMYDALKTNRKLEFLAGHFAAKEAIFKAIGSNHVLSDFSISYTKEGKPFVELKGYLVHLSISHDGGMAYANAMVETCDGFN